MTRRPSLSWRLMRWLVVFLVLVLAGFGSTLYAVTRSGTLDEVDVELRAAAEVISTGMKRKRVPWLRRRRADETTPPPRIDMPKSLANRSGAWFIVWTPDGKQYASGGTAPDDSEWSGARRKPPRTVLVDGFATRQLGVPGPHRSTIHLGRSVARELDELQWLAFRITAVGIGVLAIGIASGWWLTRRMMRPLDVIAEAAESISVEQLDGRIDTANMDDELARLGRVLNTTFARLETSFDQQTRFTADASHELRTPLSVLLTRCELALSRERSPSEYRDALGSIHTAGKRMKALVDELLQLAKLDAGAIELERTNCRLDEVVGETLTMLTPAANDARVTLHRELEPVEVLVDEQRIHRVIVNLVRNAIQHTPADGTISVTVKRDTNDAVLLVKDSGPGIPAEHLDAIFTRFHRVDSSRQRGHGGGTGIGLAITRGLVEAHGGTISAESDVGHGATFRVALPCDIASDDVSV